MSEPASGRRTRVLLVSPTFGAYGGIEAFVLAVADLLRHDPRLDVRIGFKRTAGFVSRADFEQLCQSMPVELFDRASRALWRAIRWADVVHCQNPSPDVAAVAAIQRKPVALTIHNTLPAGRFARRLAWRWAVRSARVRWYNSLFVWNTWEPRGHRSGSARVPPLSQLAVAHVEPSARRGFTFLGRLVSGKGAGVLIEAYRRAGLDPARWPLTIIGDGPKRQVLQERCAREETRGVAFTGFLTGDPKARMLAASKWLVAPSHWQEPLGLMALEARSLGVPCIVTSDGGLTEAAGSEALVCVPGDPASLAAALQEAAAMDECQYTARASRTRADLEHELVPASFYAEAYLALARGLAPAHP